MTIKDSTWANGDILTGSDLKETFWDKSLMDIQALTWVTGSWFMGGALSGLNLPRMIFDICINSSGTRNMITPALDNSNSNQYACYGTSALYHAGSKGYVFTGSIYDTLDSGYTTFGSVSFNNVLSGLRWSGVSSGAAAGSVYLSLSYRGTISVSDNAGAVTRTIGAVSQLYGWDWLVNQNSAFGNPGSNFFYLVDSAGTQVQIRKSTAGNQLFIRTTPTTIGSAFWSENGGTETKVDISSLTGSSFRLKFEYTSASAGAHNLDIFNVVRGGIDNSGVVIFGRCGVSLGRNMIKPVVNYANYGPILGTWIGTQCSGAGVVDPVVLTTYTNGSTFASGNVNSWFDPSSTIAAGSELWSTIMCPASGNNYSVLRAAGFVWRPSGNNITTVT